MPTTPTTVLNIKTPLAVKNQAQKLAEELGLPLSAVINVLLRQFIRNKFLHLESADALTPTPYLAHILDKVEKDVQTGKNTIGPFKTAQATRKYLESL